MSYIQPENSNRVNWIKKKFESNEDGSDLTKDKRIGSVKDDDKVKESLCRTLSASPITPRKNLKLNVTRQLSNPGRNIKRSPAFRGDKLTRTKNLNSPTKERVVSLVDKNVKLFEDKPEYGKLGKVKKKINDTTVYDDADCKQFLKDDEFGNDSRYGMVKQSSAEKCGNENNSRSQSIDRMNDRENFNTKMNARRDSVRTTVISRHKNISSIYGNDGENGNDDNVDYQEDEEKRAKERGLTKFDKFLKNGVEYTKVMKGRSGEVRSDREKKDKNDSEERIELRDIREELTRRKYDSKIKEERSSRWSKNLSKEDRISDYFLNNGDDYSGQTRLDFIPVKDIVLKTVRDDLASKDLSSFGEKEEIFDNKLTDTLKAALKAPLPSGPPPKKPPRTFAHSPVTNRSPVDDYEEVDGFWQKKKNRENDDYLFTNENLESSDQRGEKIRSFLHDVGSKKFANNSEISDEKILAGDLGSGDENKVQVKIPNLNSQLHRIMERSKASSNRVENLEDFGTYEPVSVGILNSEDLLKSVSKLGISPKESADGGNPRGTESSSHERGNILLNESVSSEDSATSPLNISYSPQKFKTSPPKCSRSKSSKDSKEMLDKLEHVLIQHKKASGSKVIVPRVEKPDSGVNLATKKFASESGGDTEIRSGISRHKEIFHKRLSRTLEEGRKLGPLPDLPDSPEQTRNLAFDCLPSFNCAGNSSIYEQIKNPDFKTYLTENRNSNSSDTSDVTKGSNFQSHNSQFYLLNSSNCSIDFTNSDPYDTLVVSPATKRLSTELTTFTDVKKNLMINASKKDEEHVYAEPFVFDRNLNTDFVRSESGISSPISERRFSSNNKQESSPKSFKKGAELHYMVRR